MSSIGGVTYLQTHGTSTFLTTAQQSSDGGIRRREDGSWLSGYVINIGKADVLSAELWALREGLRLAKELQLTQIQMGILGEMRNLDSTSSSHVNNFLHAYNELNRWSYILANTWYINLLDNCTAIFRRICEKQKDMRKMLMEDMLA
ncbi:Ribonuclease H domain [Dillenia turbinata]|uniref:Ribonuclease H domain n=1 Tax=Dillenia turbinata TaxID=194707 RepID=A0AAN8Z3M8_9MAGN